MNEILVPVLVALLAALPGLLSWRAQQRREKSAIEQTEAQTADVLTDTALSLLQPLERRVQELDALSDKQAKQIASLQKQVSTLTRKVRRLERNNQDLRDGASRLARQVQSLGAKPVWSPAQGDAQPGAAGVSGKQS